MFQENRQAYAGNVKAVFEFNVSLPPPIKDLYRLFLHILKTVLKMKKIILILGVTSVLIFMVGAFMKVSHYDYAEWGILTGSVLGGFFLIAVLFLFFGKNKSKTNILSAMVLLTAILSGCEKKQNVSPDLQLNEIIAKYNLKEVSERNARKIAPEKVFASVLELEHYLKSLKLPKNPFKGEAVAKLEVLQKSATQTYFESEAGSNLRVMGPCHPNGWFYNTSSVLEGGLRDISVNISFDTNHDYGTTSNINVTNVQVNQAGYSSDSFSYTNPQTVVFGDEVRTTFDTYNTEMLQLGLVNLISVNARHWSIRYNSCGGGGVIVFEVEEIE